jgi:hypothetical protein
VLRLPPRAGLFQGKCDLPRHESLLIRLPRLEIAHLNEIPRNIVLTIALCGLLGLVETSFFASNVLASSPVGTPIALLNNLKHNRVIHERNILLTFVTERVPYWADDKPRLEITAMNDRFFRVIAHFGFMEIPTIEKIAESAAAQDFELRPNRTTFFLGRETLVPARGKALSRLRRTVFQLIAATPKTRRTFFNSRAIGLSKSASRLSSRAGGWRESSHGGNGGHGVFWVLGDVHCLSFSGARRTPNVER